MQASAGRYTREVTTIVNRELAHKDVVDAAEKTRKRLESVRILGQRIQAHMQHVGLPSDTGMPRRD